MKSLLGMCLVIFACACGSSNTDNSANANPGDTNSTTGGTTGGTTTTGGTSTKVTVSGLVQPMSFLTALEGTDYVNAVVVLANPQDELTNPGANPNWLGQTALNTNDCVQGEGCPWSIPNVDISNLTIGLAAGVIDARTAGTATLAPVFTGVSQAQVVAAKSTGDLNSVVALAVRQDGFALMQNAVNANDLATNGVMMAWVLDANHAPVAGATLNTPGFSGRTWYPSLDMNQQLAGATTTAPTTACGLVIVSPSTAEPMIGSAWSVSPSTPSYVVPQTLGTAPGFAIIVPIVPGT